MRNFSSRICRTAQFSADMRRFWRFRLNDLLRVLLWFPPYALRFLLWAWQLDSACNTVRYFTMSNLTLPHCRRTLRTTHFYALLSLDPYIRRLVRRYRHSHHIHFIDPRPIGYTIHLWTAFVPLARITVSLSRLHRAFDKIGFPKMPIGVSGEAFRGVTPSFHLSDYQFS